MSMCSGTRGRAGSVAVARGQSPTQSISILFDLILLSPMAWCALLMLLLLSLRRRCRCAWLLMRFFSFRLGFLISVLLYHLINQRMRVLGVLGLGWVFFFF